MNATTLVAHAHQDIIALLDRRNEEAIAAIHVWVLIGGIFIGIGIVYGCLWMRSNTPHASAAESLWWPTLMDAICPGNRRRRALQPWREYSL